MNIKYSFNDIKQNQFAVFTDKLEDKSKNAGQQDEKSRVGLDDKEALRLGAD